MTKHSWMTLILFALAFGFFGGRFAGNVSSLFPSTINENVEISQSDDETLAQIKRLREAYESMLESRKQASKDPAKQPTREVIMFTFKGCQWCDKWMREQYAQFDAMGYKVATTEDHNLSPCPQFQVTDEKGTRHFVGYINSNNFRGP